MSWGLICAVNLSTAALEFALAYTVHDWQRPFLAFLGFVALYVAYLSWRRAFPAQNYQEKT